MKDVKRLFEEISEIMTLLYKIIFKPKETIKSSDVLSYDKKSCELVFFMTVILSGILLVMFSNNSYYRAHALSTILFIIPISLYIGRYLIVFIYFIILRIGISSSVVYKNIEILLLPYIIVLMIANNIALASNLIASQVYLLTKILISFWFAMQMYLIIYIKFKQSRVKSITIAGLPFILNVVLTILDII